MARLGETGFWACVEKVPADAKFSYQFMLGSRRLGGGEVTMPGWSAPAEAKRRPKMKYGEYIPLEFRSQIYKNQRTGWIYLPAAYSPADPPAMLMVFLDGDAYQRAEVGTIVDNL